MDNYIKLSGTLTKTSIKSQRTHDMLYISHKMPKIILYENSIIGTHTVNSDETVNNVLKECNLSTTNVYIHKQFNDQQIADYIIYNIPAIIGQYKINNIFITLNEIMVDYGYFIDTVPEYVYNEKDNRYEYIIQYEPIYPEYPNIYVPHNLRYITDVSNLSYINVYGIPNDNSKLYFSMIYDDIHISQFIRNRINFLNNENKNIDYIDITIIPPENISFYSYCNTSFPRQFISFNKIDKEYITDIKIKSVKITNKLCYTL